MRRARFALFGGIAVALGLTAAFLIAVVGGLTCAGTDAGPPSNSVVCEGRNLDVMLWGSVAGMIVAPLLGAAVSVVTGDKRGVVAGCAVAAVTLAVISFVSWRHF